MWRFSTTIWCDPGPVPFTFLLVSVPSDYFPRGFHTKLRASCILHLSNMKGPLGLADFTVNKTRVLLLRIYWHIVNTMCHVFTEIAERMLFALQNFYTSDCSKSWVNSSSPPPPLLLSLFCRCFVLLYMWHTTMNSRMRWSLLKIWGLRSGGDIE